MKSAYHLKRHPRFSLLPSLVSSLLLSAVFVTAAPLAHADTPAGISSRLDKIKQTGTISLGYPTSSLPFAYLDNNHQPIGYSVDLCQHIVAALKTKLGMKDLAIHYVPITSATRLPLLANGTIDLECGNTTNTVDRHKLVSFAPTTFVAKVVLLARKDSGLDPNNPAAFAGKTITSLAGGLDLQLIQKVSTEQHLNISVVPANDAAATFIAVKTGRAMAVSTDDGIAYGQVATSGDPQDYVIGSKPLAVAPYGIVEPKDDPQFKTAVDNAVLDLIKTKQIYTIYDKWFNAPVPPSGINLKYPMSAELQHALEHPSDSGDPASYQ